MDHTLSDPESTVECAARALGMSVDELCLQLIELQRARAVLDAAPPVSDAYVARGCDRQVRRARQRHQRLLIERAARQRVRARRQPAARLPVRHVVSVRPVARARRVQRDSDEDGDGDADPSAHSPSPATLTRARVFLRALRAEVRS